jgi:hypothetical protein
VAALGVEAHSDGLRRISVMQTTGERIHLAIAPDRLQLAPGGWAQITVSVTNGATIVDQIELHVEGVDPSWLTISTTSLELFPGAAGTFTVDIQLPEHPAPAAGVQQIQVAAVSRADASNVARIELPLEVLATGAVAVTLSPQRVNTRGTGRFRVELTNDGNEDRPVDLVVSDPEAALATRLVPDRIAVPAGQRREADLRVTPHRRRLFAPARSYPFTVTVFPAGAEAAEPLGTVDGTLVYRGPLLFLVALFGGARRALIALVALLAAAAVAIWFLAPPVRQTVAKGLAMAAQGADQETAAAVAEEAAQQAAAQQTAAAQAAAGSSGGSGTPATPATPVPLPTISTFELAVPPGAARGEFELSWDVQGAAKVELDGAPQQQLKGTQRVQTLEDREFQLTATNAAGAAVTRSVGIVLLTPPVIGEFAASAETVAPGQPVTLSWDVRQRATRIGIQGIDDQLKDAKGSLAVTPAGPATTYTLSAQNEFGTVTSSVTVRVVEPAAAPSA